MSLSGQCQYNTSHWKVLITYDHGGLERLGGWGKREGAHWKMLIQGRHLLRQWGDFALGEKPLSRCISFRCTMGIKHCFLSHSNHFFFSHHPIALVTVHYHTKRQRDGHHALHQHIVLLVYDGLVDYVSFIIQSYTFAICMVKMVVSTRETQGAYASYCHGCCYRKSGDASSIVSITISTD